MKAKYIFLVISLLSISKLATAITYTWTGSADTVFTNKHNWSQPPFSPSTYPGFPTSGDTAIIVASAANRPTLSSDRDVYRLVITSGNFDLKGYTFTSTGSGLFSGGTIENGALDLRGTKVEFTGTIFNVTVDVFADIIALSGGIFNEICIFTTTGQADSEGMGGCVFNEDVQFIHTGINGKVLLIAKQTGDQFNGNVTFINNSNSQIRIADRDSTYFNGNIELNNMNTGLIYIGYKDGYVELATGKTISVGDSGFFSGELYLNNFTQNGNTSQSLVLTDSSKVYIQKGCVFEGNLTLTAPDILCGSSTFYGTTQITKTKTSGNYWSGDNIFNGVTTITYQGTGGGAGDELRLTSKAKNIYDNNISFESSGNPMQVLIYNGSDFYKNVSNNNAAIFFRKGLAQFKGTNAQALNGTALYDFDEVIIDKAAEQLTLNTPLNIHESVQFDRGNIISDTTNIITFQPNSKAIGAHNGSFVSGPVKKLGDTAFEFPVGKGNDFRPLEISTPETETDVFLGEYFNEEQGFTDNLDSSLYAISNCNYWNLIQLNGDSEIDIIFKWSGENCLPFDTAIFNMTFLADTLWIDIGHGVIFGTHTNGEVAVSDISDFGYFTFGTNAPEIVAQGGLTKNEGQLLDTNRDPADSVLYYYYNGPVAYYLFENKIAYSYGFHDAENEVDSSYRMDLKFVNANDAFSISQTDQVYYKNFYLGHTGSGIDSVGVFRTIEFDNIYEKINLQATIGTGLQLKFIFEAGGSMDSIRLSFEGADSIKINQDGTIKIFAATRMLEFAKPFGIQTIGESMYKIAITPLIVNDILTFSASYNPSYPLLFNFGPRPVRGHTTGNKWSTYMEGSSFFDGAEDLWLDGDDNIYMVGACINSDLPVAIGEYTQHSGTYTDAFLFKFNTNRGIVWGTYYGGDGPDNGTGVAVNSEGYVYITGVTSSTDLPVCTTCTADALLKEDILNLGNGIETDIFIAKFGGDGSSQPTSTIFPDVFRTYYGGEGLEIARCITIDNNDNVYIGGGVNNSFGYLSSGTTSYGTFPEIILTGAYNQEFGQAVDLWDAFLLKIDENNDVLWSTAIGGDTYGNQEMISALTFDSGNNIYASGVTNAVGPSTIPEGPITSNTTEKFPLADPDLISSTDYTVGNSGGMDAFVIKVNSADEISWSTMYGGQGNENSHLSDLPSWNLTDNYMNSGIAVNSSGDIYITGSTTSNSYGSFPDFPQRVLTGSANYYNQSLFNNGTCGGTIDAFIAMFNSDFELEWSTFYGGCGNEAGVAIACDKFDGHTYITGFTTSSDFPVKTLSGSHSQSLNGSSDAFVLGFLNNLRDYAMYFGGTGGPTEIGKGVVTDDYGINLIFCGTSDDYNGSSTSDFPYSDLPGINDYFWSTVGLTGDPNQKAYIANLRFGCNPCWRISGSMETSSTLQEAQFDDLQIFPNPASTYIEFSYKGNHALQRIIVYDAYGKMIFSDEYRIQTIDISELNPGIYIIRLLDQSGNAVSKKFIKE